MSGDWGTEIITGTVAAGTVGATTYARNDVALHPTMALLTGTVDGPSGTIGNVDVRVAGAGLARTRSQPSDLTNSSGLYELYVILREGASSGSLTYTLKKGTSHTFTRSFNAPVAGEVNTVTHNFTLP